MQRQGSGFHRAPDHGVVHQPLQLQHHRALLGAAHGLGAGLHRQQGLLDQPEPGFQGNGFVRNAFIRRPDAAALAVPADDDALDLQAQDRELNRGRGAVQAV